MLKKKCTQNGMKSNTERAQVDYFFPPYFIMAHPTTLILKEASHDPKPTPRDDKLQIIKFST